MARVVDPFELTRPGAAAEPADRGEQAKERFAGRYELLEEVGRGGMGVVFRARDWLVGDIVALKILERGGDDSLACVRREVRLARRISHPNVVRTHDLGEVEGRAYISMEFVEGTTLAEVIRSERGTLEQARAVAIAATICDGLAAAHLSGVVHRDLKPTNVLVDLYGRVALTDFGISRALEDEAEAPATDSLAGTALYMAPEQINGLDIDALTDIYAFGLVFYELLVGERPFARENALAEVLARAGGALPADPRELRPELAPELAALALDCLSAERERRPQSAVEVASRLREWAAKVAEAGVEALLEWPERGHGLRFSERLFGREVECAVVREVLARARSGSGELLVVDGVAGVGKSSLLHSVIGDDIAALGGIAVTVDAEALPSELPFAAVIGLMDAIVERIRRTEMDSRRAWREKLSSGLGASAAHLSALIPALDELLGAQPAPTAAAAGATGQLVELAIRRFFDVVIARESLVALVIEGIHQIDRASVELLGKIIDSGERFVIAGTLRSEDSVASLSSIRGLFRVDSGRTTEIALGLLKRDDVGMMVADALRTPRLEVDELACDIFLRTRGNPLLVREFLRRLERDGVIHRDRSSRRWQWSTDNVVAAELPEDVVALVVSEVEHVSPESRRVLEVAACFGGPFGSEQLARAAGEVDARQALLEGLSCGLLLPLDREYRRLGWGGDGSSVSVTMDFAHSRIRRAFLDEISRERLEDSHHRVGRVLLEDARATGTLQSSLYAILEHLNVVRCRDRAEANELVSLNLAASRRARATTAYMRAVAHLERAAELVEREGLHDRRFRVLLELAVSRHLGGDDEAALEALTRAMAQAQSSAEIAEGYSVEVMIATRQGRANDAIERGVHGLRRLGVDVPEDQVSLARAVEAESARSRSLLARKEHGDIVNAGPLQDSRLAGIHTLLVGILAAANLNCPALFAYLSAFQVNLSLSHGAAPESPYGYVVHGFHLATTRREYGVGYELGRLGVALHERGGTDAATCRIRFVFASYVHLFLPLSEAVDEYSRAIEAGESSGDFLHRSFACSQRVIARLLLGEPILAVEAECEGFLADSTVVASVRASLEVSRQVARCLRGATRSRTSLADGDFDEISHAAMTKRRGYRFALHWIEAARALLCLIAGEYREALVAVDRHRAAGGEATEFASNTIVAFYEGVAAARLLQAGAQDGAGLRARIEVALGRLDRWAASSPAVYRHCSALVRALVLVADGSHDSVDGLEDAVEEAEATGFLSHAALANELAGRFHRRCGRRKIARMYLRDARELYERWGVTWRCAELAMLANERDVVEGSRGPA